MINRSRSPVWRWMAVLLILAYAFKAFVPTGYMPDSTQHGGGLFSLQLCTPDGIITISPTEIGYDVAGSSSPPSQDGRSDIHPCTWCASNLSIPILLLALAIFLTVTPPLPLIPRPTSQGWIARTFLCGPLGSRAPPSDFSLL